MNYSTYSKPLGRIALHHNLIPNQQDTDFVVWAGWQEFVWSDDSVQIINQFNIILLDPRFPGVAEVCFLIHLKGEEDLNLFKILFPKYDDMISVKELKELIGK